MRHWFKAIVFLIVAALAACGDDDTGFGPGYGAIGAPCREHRDCPSRCEDGFCTVKCDNDAHCPPGTACIDDHGGICAPVCGSPASCGPGFECASRDRRGADGSIGVCRGL